MKHCRTCDETQPLARFNSNRSSHDGYQSQCKSCRAAYNREHYRNNKDAYIKRAKKTNWEKHNLAQEEYDFLLALRGGMCHICMTRPAVAIDHDHSCCPGDKSCGTCVRGVLCSSCNSGIGHLRDDPMIMRRAVDYIESMG